MIRIDAAMITAFNETNKKQDLGSTHKTKPREKEKYNNHARINQQVASTKKNVQREVEDSKNEQCCQLEVRLSKNSL